MYNISFRKFSPLAVVFFLFLIGFVGHDAFAVIYDIKDQASCQLLPSGSPTWNSTTHTCAVTNININIANASFLKLENGVHLIINGGTIVIDSGGNLSISGNSNNFGTINNSGNITISGISNNFGTINNSGNITNYGGFNNNSPVATINNNSGGTINNLALGVMQNNGKIYQGGKINNSNIIRNYDTIQNNSGGFLTNIKGAAFYNGPGGAIINAAGSTIANSGLIDNNSGGTINNSGTIDGDSPINNAGTINNNCSGTIFVSVTGNPVNNIPCVTPKLYCGKPASAYAHVINGTNGDDNLVGTKDNDLIIGNDGNDVITGGAGDDCLIGGAGNDTIRGGDGNDYIIGDKGDDHLYGGNGNDTIRGGDGSDYISGDAGDDHLYGGNGNDTIYGVDGNDYINGDGGDDKIYGGNGDDILHGGDGNDYVNGDAGNDKIFGEAGNDTLYGGIGNDHINGDAGTDTCVGGPGTDTILNCESSAQCIAPPSNLVGWWAADGNTNDLIGSNTGTISGSVSFAPGKVSQAFSFDGTGSVNVGSLVISSDTQPFSEIAWINPSTSAINDGLPHTIVAEGSTPNNSGNGKFMTHSSLVGSKGLGKIEVEIGATQTYSTIKDTSPIIPPGKWSLVAVTYDGSRTASGIKVYVNGIEQIVTTTIGSGFTGTAIPRDQWAIGTQVGGTNPFVGLIDESEIFNTAVTQQVIQSEFNADSGGKCKPASR